MDGTVEDVEEEEEPGMQVTLHEDKKYYPSAEEVRSALPHHYGHHCKRCCIASVLHRL